MFRCARNNKRKEPIYYATFIASEEKQVVKDGFTLYTGDRGGEYTEPVPAKVSVSPNKGDSDIALFGTELKYDRTLAYDSTGPVEINEYSRLWVDVPPYIEGVLQPHDYEVKAVSISHDRSSYVVAIARVNKNEYRS